jgi:adenine C2-methylase RlmN of 23S rRNA A2503 and tRNA A37
MLRNRKDIERFKNNLENHGIEENIRVAHGRNIKAACGQLAGKYSNQQPRPEGRGMLFS